MQQAAEAGVYGMTCEALGLWLLFIVLVTYLVGGGDQNGFDPAPAGAVCGIVCKYGGVSRMAAFCCS